jgi:hypothetical protein
MKNFVFSLVMLFVSFVGFGQVIIAEIDQWSTFECKFTENYDSIVGDKNLTVLGYGFGRNTLKFDLSAKTYKFFFLDDEFSSGIMDYKINNGVYIFTCKTIDRKTNEPMDLFVTVNTNNMKSNDPYVTQFYSDVNTNKSYGIISYLK